MQQIHCLLNSLAHCISPKADARPLFFGAWDTPFAVEEDRLTYFSTQITNETYVSMFELLYEKKLETWYDYQLSKEANYERLRNLAESVTPGKHLLVQLDLYYLRYETRSFRNIHQPHFVIILQQQDGKWFLLDPYFAWEGILTEEEMYCAFFNNALGGGFFLDTENLLSPLKNAVCAQFEQEFALERNQLAHETKKLVRRFMDEPYEDSKAVITKAFSQVGIISKRKWCYVLAFDYFSESEAIHSDRQGFDEVEKLVKGWNAFGYLAIRASMGVTSLDKLLEKAEQLEIQERQLKEKLWHLYQGWRRAQST
ncbi:DUF6005 family protein [Paenibacillus solani]|uniref:Butirosin biosynthesis protein H N-terminal domain-containing protein n=1 Tax=Paenibacillus solani TaxID=1705565 RepID=A0A0M1N3M6_9BACL|nr:DUF6005 family protein [Paenibacillus solani]KOR76758.1 hypothetical protein AM231_22700 [Paenibacillus solani]